MAPDATWELHYAAPRYAPDMRALLRTLEALVDCYSNLHIDFDQDERGDVHVMVGDAIWLKRVIIALAAFDLKSVSVQFYVDGETAAEGKKYDIPLTASGDSEVSIT